MRCRSRLRRHRVCESNNNNNNVPEPEALSDSDRPLWRISPLLALRWRAAILRLLLPFKYSPHGRGAWSESGLPPPAAGASPLPPPAGGGSGGSPNGVGTPLAAARQHHKAKANCWEILGSQPPRGGADWSPGERQRFFLNGWKYRKNMGLVRVISCPFLFLMKDLAKTCKLAVGHWDWPYQKATEARWDYARTFIMLPFHSRTYICNWLGHLSCA